MRTRRLARLGDRKPGEVRDLDLATVDGQTHGDKRGDERDRKHRHGTEEDVEKALHAHSGYRLIVSHGYRWPVQDELTGG